MAISKLLGHSTFTTTMVYLHCRRQHLQSIPSPLDWLSEPPKPFLVDNKRLGCQFRDAFIAGVERLTKAGKLQIVEALELKSTLEKLRACAWVVFIEGPPTYRSKAEHVLKYLARYITGGPIGTSRLIDNAAGAVSFWARSRDKSKYFHPISSPR
jgi:hypothetical protein